MKISPRIWKRVLWLLAVGAVLALIARHLTASEEWRAFRWDHLWKIFRQVYLGFLLAAVAVSLSTYLLRALRWRSFLEHIVHVPLKTLVAGQFIGFSTVYLIGRAGELVRPAYVARRGGVPFVSMAAVWLLERVYDSVFIFLILGLGLSLGGIDPTRPQDSAFIRALEISSRGLLFLLLILIVGLIYFQMKAEGAISHLSSSKPIPLLSERRKKMAARCGRIFLHRPGNHRQRAGTSFEPRLFHLGLDRQCLRLLAGGAGAGGAEPTASLGTEPLLPSFRASSA